MSVMVSHQEDKVDLSTIREARGRVDHLITRTPVMTSSFLNTLSNRNLFFKCELMQKTGSFKVCSHFWGKFTSCMVYSHRLIFFHFYWGVFTSTKLFSHLWRYAHIMWGIFSSFDVYFQFLYIHTLPNINRLCLSMIILAAISIRLGYFKRYPRSTKINDKLFW